MLDPHQAEATQRNGLQEVSFSKIYTTIEPDGRTYTSVTDSSRGGGLLEARSYGWRALVYNELSNHLIFFLFLSSSFVVFMMFFPLLE